MVGGFGRARCAASCQHPGPRRPGHRGRWRRSTAVRLEILVRGVDADPDALRQRLGLRGSRSLKVVITPGSARGQRRGGGRWCAGRRRDGVASRSRRARVAAMIRDKCPDIRNSHSSFFSIFIYGSQFPLRHRLFSGRPADEAGRSRGEHSWCRSAGHVGGGAPRPGLRLVTLRRPGVRSGPSPSCD